MTRRTLLLAALGAFASRYAKRRRRVITHGLYENCEPGHPEAFQRLEEMRDIGVTRVLNYYGWQGSDIERLAYADRANALGIKLCWPANGTDEQITFVRNHPATWGFYIGEEPRTWSQQEAINAYGAHLRELTDKPRLFVDWGWKPASIARAELEPQKDVADVLALDYYPVGIDKEGMTVGYTGEIARAVKEACRSWDREAAMVLQAFAWSCEPNLAPPGSHEWPTRNQMRRQLQLTVDAGINRVWWFNYFFLKGAGCGNPDPSHIEDLRAVIAGE